MKQQLLTINGAWIEAVGGNRLYLERANVRDLDEIELRRLGGLTVAFSTEQVTQVRVQNLSAKYPSRIFNLSFDEDVNRWTTTRRLYEASVENGDAALSRQLGAIAAMSQHLGGGLEDDMWILPTRALVQPDYEVVV